VNCQRTVENVRHHCCFEAARNPGLRPVTWGSRRRGHRIRGSVKSTGLFTPWCSVR